jgi:hypothetical protein
MESCSRRRSSERRVERSRAFMNRWSHAISRPPQAHAFAFWRENASGPSRLGSARPRGARRQRGAAREAFPDDLGSRIVTGRNTRQPPIGEMWVPANGVRRNAHGETIVRFATREPLTRARRGRRLGIVPPPTGSRLGPGETRASSEPILRRRSPRAVALRPPRLREPRPLVIPGRSPARSLSTDPAAVRCSDECSVLQKGRCPAEPHEP